MADSRFPSKDADFNDYVHEAIPRMASEQARLNIDAAMLTALQDMFTTWQTKYPQSQNPSTATSVIRAEKTALRKDMEAQMRDIYKDLADSLLNESDRQVFNIPERDSTPSARGKINDTPIIGLKSTGSGEVRVRARTTTDASRASRHELADGLEVKYLIGDNTPPQSVEDCPTSFISKKAIFTISLGTTHAGKRFYAYMRWVNLSNQNNNGPWTGLNQTVIT